WNLDEEKAMINYLIEHKDEAGDGLNFKDTTWTKVAECLQPLRTDRGVKMGKKCKEKQGQLLRKPYSTIMILKANVSGFLWTDKDGCKVDIKMEDSWNIYCKTHEATKQFKNKGFAHYESMTMILPQTVKG
ncbi:hypothetical protein PILCRDRAFT_50140, partial [Piloderma croceum F 1598]